MALLKPIINIPELLVKKGVNHAIISPGSRNAPLTIAFARHPAIEARSVSDERSAAFIAMGMAQVTKNPVTLICTSGSAAYNYAPAVAEAFFQEIPLLVLTADRPKEWIHQHDGQTIYQTDIFGKHVKKSFELPADYEHPDSVWAIERIVNDAVNLAKATPQGPVHINVPLREPFYPAEGEELSYDADVRVIKRLETTTRLDETTWADLLASFEQADKILIAGGQDALDVNLSVILDKLRTKSSCVLLADSISNISVDTISKHDLFLKPEQAELAPSLLITFGKSFISKGLKTFLRKYKAIEHWHLQLDTHLIDALQSMTTIIPMKALDFFSELERRISPSVADERMAYANAWHQQEDKARTHIASFMDNTSLPFYEFFAVKQLMDALPEGSLFHLANSMTVRYGNYIGVNPEKQIEVFANRGTSGIDGCVSTAVGTALVTDKPVYLIIGDVAFFYDRNGLWNRYLPKNLKILLLNNHGGGIFRMIDGPAKQPELGDFFETVQHFDAKLTAEESGMVYFSADNFDNFTENLAKFMNLTEKSALFEVKTSPEINTKVFKQFKSTFDN